MSSLLSPSDGMGVQSTFQPTFQPTFQQQQVQQPLQPPAPPFRQQQPVQLATFQTGLDGFSEKAAMTRVGVSSSPMHPQVVTANATPVSAVSICASRQSLIDDDEYAATKGKIVQEMLG